MRNFKKLLKIGFLRNFHHHLLRLYLIIGLVIESQAQPISIPFYQNTLEMDSLLPLNVLPLPYDYKGEKTPYKTTFKIALLEEEQTLFFSFQTTKSPLCDTLISGTFMQDLWKKDVAELFIKSADSQVYQEFNFSPTGAYWSAIFKEYRQLEKEWFFEPVNIVHLYDETHWKITFSIALKDLYFDLLKDDVLINVCAILYTPSDTIYIDDHCKTPTPDFHHSQNFSPVQILDK